MVESGALEVLLESAPVCTLSPGSLFDEEALIAVDAPAPATLRAAYPSQVGVLLRKAVVRELSRLPFLRMALDVAWRHRILAARIYTIDLFHDLAPAVRLKLVDQFDLIDIPGGSVLATEGEPGNAFYVIRDGEATLHLQPGGGPDEPTTATLGVGDYLGELSLIEDKAHTATVTAPYDVAVAKLDRRSFNKVMKAHPGALETIKTAIKRRDESIL
jgi:cAMP-dependent protein kinase regulator